jgi:hypothetical protein
MLLVLNVLSVYQYQWGPGKEKPSSPIYFSFSKGTKIRRKRGVTTKDIQDQGTKDWLDRIHFYSERHEHEFF